MADSNYNQIISELANGINIDVDPEYQPKGSRRYSLNTVEKTSEGHINLANEPSNAIEGKFPLDFIPLGDRYMNKGETVVILKNPLTGREQIGLIDKTGEYFTHVDTASLKLDVKYQCEIKFRVRRGNDRVIYWVDGLNNARSFNLDRPEDYYTAAYALYLKQGGNPATYPTEKWDYASFELIRTYATIPTFDKLEVLEFGSIQSGSYNFAIQYVDEDLNPTEWITTSNPVNIFCSSLDTAFEQIRGSRNVNTSTQSWGRASKTIRLTLGNMDDSYPFYRVAIIRASAGTGEPDKAFGSEIQSTRNLIFTYAGNDAELVEVPLEDILIPKQVIYAPQHLEQQENRLQLLNSKGKGINWCDFQAFASKIGSKLTTKEVVLNLAASEPNVKNPYSTFEFKGYMPGEVYSFGIVYVFKDGYISPTFHIPGGNITLDDGTGRGMLTTNMLYHELSNYFYEDIHACSTSNYWGTDSTTQSLLNNRVRHHRFPFRKDINKPLVERTGVTTTITRYRLSLVITENPASPPIWPLDSSGNDLGIEIKIDYQKVGSLSYSQYSSRVFPSNMGKAIVIYDGLDDLQFIISGQRYQINPLCEFFTFQGGSKPDFFLVQVYPAPYTVSTTQNTDVTEILGISFSGITAPHPDVIGCYIVRNDRRDDDRMVIDTALFGNMTEFNTYKSFGLLAPKQFYPVDNCGREGSSTTEVKFCKDALWFFNPEYQFFQKKNTFEELVVEGSYKESDFHMPIMSNQANPTPPDPICNTGGTKGVYIDDVQAGTTYDPDRDKHKAFDDDGFDLNIGYRDTEFAYAPVISLTAPSPKVIDDPDKVLYLTAATYQNYKDTTYYNTSVDNKIGMYIPKTPVADGVLRDDTGSTVGGATNLVYAAMIINNDTSYSNFINRPYFKEHNNLLPLNTPGVNTVNDFRVFNGDVEISALSIVSSVFYDIVVGDRPKKHSLWKIVVGAIVIAAAIAVTVATAGAGAPAAFALTVTELGALTSMAVAAMSYGVSLLVSGIKFDQFQAMAQTDYALGLKESVVDGGVFECVREDIGTDDDTIRWFGDRIDSVYMESTVSMGLRNGLTCGVPDFMDAPTKYNEGLFRSYMIEKLTTLDRNQGAGRLYRGYASAEIYDMNLDFLRHNHEKIFTHLPIEYDCCSDFKEVFPRRVHWSEQSFQEEKVDNYRAFLPNNYADIEGEHGEITGVYRLGNSLYIQTREGTWNLPQNQQERVTNEIVSFIGTGNLFSILPRKVVDDDMGSLGTIHKWANIKTSMGVFSISEPENKIFLHSDKIKEISADGIMSYTNENVRQFLSEQLYNVFGIVFPNTNNPTNPFGTGYISTFDIQFNRVIFTKRDYLLLPDKVNTVTIVGARPTNPLAVDFVYSTDDNIFYQGTIPIALSNRDYFEDKSFTISYSLNTEKWVSWHSYIPTFYIHSKGRMFSYYVGEPLNSYWIHNVDGSYHTFYGIKYPHILEGVLSTGGRENTFEDITIQTRALFYSPTNKQFLEKRHITFNKIVVYNGLQSSGELYMAVKQEQPSRQDWFNQQTKRTVGQIIISRENGGWNINDFRDYVIDPDTPMFTSDWLNTQSIYPIDKIVTPLVTDFRKDWRFLESFRGKYIVFRLKFDNFDNVNLITNYLLSTTNVSD